MVDGDLYVLSVEDIVGRQYLLASFHGDTNGLATLPVFTGVHNLAASMPNHRLIVGLDANTYEVGSASQQGVTEFAADFVAKGYTSCWGDTPNPKSHTTFNARTFLQVLVAMPCMRCCCSSLLFWGLDGVPRSARPFFC